MSPIGLISRAIAYALSHIATSSPHRPIPCLPSSPTLPTLILTPLPPPEESPHSLLIPLTRLPLLAAPALPLNGKCNSAALPPLPEPPPRRLDTSYTAAVACDAAFAARSVYAYCHSLAPRTSGDNEASLAPMLPRRFSSCGWAALACARSAESHREGGYIGVWLELLLLVQFFELVLDSAMGPWVN